MQATLLPSPSRATRLLVIALFSLFLPVHLFGQTPPATVTLPAGTPLPVQLPANLPLRVGTPVRAQLLYPVYADNTLILPANTTLTGTVTALRPDHPHRNRARLRADFTPFSTPVVQFNGLLLSDGSTLPIVTGTASEGAPIYRIIAKPRTKGGLIGQEFEIAKQSLHDTFHLFIDPGKADRAQQLLYSQLPYHPQRIAKGTAWTVETTAPITLAPQPDPSPTLTAASKPAPPKPTTKPAATPDPNTWMIQAYLSQPLSSATSKQGQPIQATVAEPIYNPDHSLAIPQGATVIGSITRSKPARRFGRAGALQFDFRQLVLPTGTSQNVTTIVTGVDSASSEALAMSTEGKVQPKPKDKILLPLLLINLASRPLDQEGGALHQAGKNGTASNSLGLAGFIIGISGQSPNLAAGFGAYGAALAIYDRWIQRGAEVEFARNTRIVLQTTPRHASKLSGATR